MIVAQKKVCLLLAEPALLAEVAEAAEAVVAVEVAYQQVRQLLAQRAGIVMNGLLASQMDLAGEHAMMQIAVALLRISPKSCRHAPMKEAAMME